jgi:DnaJ-domain-containing protein 1
MRRWYGKLLGLVAGAALFRANPLLGGLIGMLLGHAFDVDWFRLRRRDDPYRVLGVTEEVDEAELDRAYRRLIAQYHPDRLSGAAPELRQQAERRAREINNAYDRIRALRQNQRKP